MTSTCPNCKTPVGSPTPLGPMIKLWECPLCGKFALDFTIETVGIPKDITDKISAYTRSQSGSTPPALTKELFEILRAAPDKTLRERVAMLLDVIESRSGHFGQKVQFIYSSDFPLIEAKNANEFKAICELHLELGNVKHEQTDAGQDIALSLSAKGYEAIETTRRTNVYSEKVFVAMWFDSSLMRVYLDEIAAAIEDAGYKPIRIDMEEHNDDIVARVLTEIRGSRFLIADFTGHRNGVYFEAGFAKGLGLEVIWLRRDDPEKPHFDTEHFNHLVWKHGETFRKKLHSRIVATIGPGPLNR